MIKVFLLSFSFAIFKNSSLMNARIINSVIKYSRIVVDRNNKTESFSMLQNVTCQIVWVQCVMVCGMNWQLSRLLVLFLIVGTDRGMAFKNM